MPPDLNSLPPSRSTSASPRQQRSSNNNHNQASSSSDAAMANHSPSRRSSSVSLAAAATINAADLSRRSSTSANRASPQAGRVHERRRSAAAMNLNQSDPSMPGPGELSSSDHRASVSGNSAFRTASPTSLGGSPIVSTGDPHHQRTPSLGELHQELEQEQEAQVNRLLLMIRQQQAQLQQFQQHQHPHAGASSTAVVDDSTPTSERSVSFPSLPPLPPSSHRSSMHVHSARRGSNQTSPALGSQSEPVSNTTADTAGVLGGDGIAGRRGSRDESSYYQAETAALTRENQMLRLRIRELERQVSEMTASPAHTPATSSQLVGSSSASEALPTPAGVEPEKT